MCEYVISLQAFLSWRRKKKKRCAVWIRLILAIHSDVVGPWSYIRLLWTVSCVVRHKKFTFPPPQNHPKETFLEKKCRKKNISSNSNHDLSIYFFDNIWLIPKQQCHMNTQRWKSLRNSTVKTLSLKNKHTNHVKKVLKIVKKYKKCSKSHKKGKNI